ncbi:MAG TPA: sensor histidine kinase [Chitinophagaceae bacterium]|nr:sensor histidine kinase [Chitinophagaceae bacterium]
MKAFWKYVFPPLYGLLVYFTIRLLLDSTTGMKFWHRPWTLNLLEISTSMVMGYFLLWVFGRLLAYYDRTGQSDFTAGRIARELLGVFLVNQVIQNAILTPMAAFTDDGLQWYDLVDINTIPLLYALIYYGVARSHGFLQAYVQNRLQLEKMTNDQLQTELKFLKAQYHPHFLFNALNTIYFQMDEDVAGAKRTVEKFSELLRYQLYDQQQTVPVSSEVHYLRNFIDLQQIRSSEKLVLRVCFDPGLDGQQVYPLLFLPLVENAFKYVGGDYRMDISLKKERDGLSFRIENSLPADWPVERRGGIGLENLRRRLALLYPGRHRFSAQFREDRYIAELSLILS